MSPRIVTPAEAREMLDGAPPGPWKVWGDYASDCVIGTPGGDMDIAEVSARCDDEDGVAAAADRYESDARLLAAAPDLAATVASEPERVAAAVNAERARIVDTLNTLAATYAQRAREWRDAGDAAKLGSAANAYEHAALIAAGLVTP